MPAVSELPTTDDITLSDEVLGVGVTVVVVMLAFRESWYDGLESGEGDMFMVHKPASVMYRKEFPLLDLTVALFEDRIFCTLLMNVPELEEE